MSQPVKLVVGFHDCTPKPPKLAAANGLNARVAFVQESYLEGHGEMFFDAALFLKLIKAASTVIAFDDTDVMIGVPSNFVRQFIFGEKLKREGDINSLPELFQKTDDPPSQIRWLKAGVPVAIGVCERWYLVGGPQPYHDSYTFSLFVAEKDKDHLVAALSAAAKSASAACELINGGTR